MSYHAIRIIVAAFLFVATLTSSATVARAGLSREAFEKQAEDELRSLDEGAIELFRRAEAARRASDMEQARTLYADLHERVPDFVHATRRLCSIESWMGNRGVALELCRAALATRVAPENQVALANALIMTDSAIVVPRKELAEAEQLVRAALKQDPESVFANQTACQLALNTANTAQLVACSGRLRELAPKELGSWWFSALAAADSGHWGEARERLQRARELGLPDELYQGLDEVIAEHESTWPGVLELAAVMVAAWLALMLALIIVGTILSRKTSRAADAITGADADQPVHPAGATLRSIYKTVLQVSCAVYYLSLPLLVVVVVLTGGGILYGFWAAGYIPVKGAAVIAGVTLLTVVAILKSMWVRGSDDDPGMRLDGAEHPELRAVLDEVAARVGTRSVDNVYLTPGAEIAVLERGAVLAQLRGTSERCLVLGLAVLDGMSLPAFKSILAHEYGHFSNRDTASGGLALAVRRSFGSMARRLAESGSAEWYNPAWLFLQVFHRVFLRISHGASRLQEILADRWAVASYGARNFESGLRHAIASSVRFDAHADRVIEEVVESQTPLRNLYQHQPSEPIDEKFIADDVEAVINAEPSHYDSHPRPADRIRWAYAMNADEPEDEPCERDAASLLSDRESLEAHMTEEVRSNVELAFGVALS